MISVVLDRAQPLPHPMSEQGHLFRTVRKAAGLTQEKAAEILGIGRTSITNMEAGRQPITLTHLEAMADVINADVVLYLIARRSEP